MFNCLIIRRRAENDAEAQAFAKEHGLMLIKIRSVKDPSLDVTSALSQEDKNEERPRHRARP